MAATITLHVWTGASAHTDGGAASEFNFGSADAADDTAAWRLSNPITIPAAGCAYSYEKYISACLGTAPNNSVGNFQIWGSPPTGSYATGTCWLIGVAACVNETADRPGEHHFGYRYVQSGRRHERREGCVGRSQLRGGGL
jgi:hypothetical protein